MRANFIITLALTSCFVSQIHQRVPLFIGSEEEVEKLEKFLA